MPGRLVFALQFLLGIGILLGLWTALSEFIVRVPDTRLEAMRQRWNEACETKIHNVTLCRTTACEIALREKGLVSEVDALNEWVDGARGEKGLLYAAASRSGKVSYWQCEMQDLVVARASTAKEAEAQPYFSPR